MSQPSTFRHPLEGVWRNESFEYTVRQTGLVISVHAIDTDDGEVFLISNVEIAAASLRFHLFIPSSGYRMEHVFRSTPSGVRDEWTTIDTDGARSEHAESLERD
jgi:hypothetical protein